MQRHVFEDGAEFSPRLKDIVRRYPLIILLF
jgi:hypothetical protein